MSPKSKVTLSQFRQIFNREPTTAEKYALLLRACRDDPNAFNDHILGRTYVDINGIKHPATYWYRQKEICESVVKYKTTICATGNSVGKSFLLAGIVLWWLYTRINSLVIITAPTQTLVGSVVFKEIRRAHLHSKIPLAGQVTDSPKASPQTLALNGSGWQALGLATRGVERLSGQHAPQLLVVVDEGSGVEEEIYEAIDSLNALKSVICGNPIRAEGRFKNLAEQARREKDDKSIPEYKKVHLISIPSTESPDINEERSPRGLADKGFLDDNERKYGKNSLWWRTHILALFPELAFDILLPEEWLDLCPNAVRQHGIIVGHTRIGIDLGEGVGRDNSVILIRDDLGILDIEISNNTKPKDVATRVKFKKFRWGVEEFRITYDSSGMLGQDFSEYLYAEGLVNCTPYTGSMSGGADFGNLRALAGWRLRRRLDPETTLDPPIIQPNLPIIGIQKPPRIKQQQFHIPAQDWWFRLRRELKEIKYHLQGRKTWLQTKEELKDILGSSPDIADALIQTFAFLN